MFGMDPLWAMLHEELAPLGPVRIRRMFGGAGVSLDGLSIGLIADDVLYLKCDAASTPHFVAQGLEPFVYVKNGQPMAMSYRQAPDAALDDGDTLRQWAGLALAAARRAAAKRAPSARRPRRR
jgi:DNA transformation protein